MTFICQWNIFSAAFINVNIGYVKEERNTKGMKNNQEGTTVSTYTVFKCTKAFVQSGVKIKAVKLLFMFIFVLLQIYYCSNHTKLYIQVFVD